jgi:AcrR family transcriptional regulator
MGNPRISRRAREKARQRREILAVALGLFSEKGYHNVSMHEIARTAEFAVGTLYNFFRNKEDLYRALLLELSDKFHYTLTTAIEESDDETEKLRNYVRAKGQVFRENASMIRLYFAETRGATYTLIADLDPEIRERYARFLKTLASIFESGMKKKKFERIAEPASLAVALEGIMNAFLFHWLEEPRDYPYPENPDVILNILFRGLLQGVP